VKMAPVAATDTDFSATLTEVVRTLLPRDSTLMADPIDRSN